MAALDVIDKLLTIFDEAVFPLLAAYLVWLVREWLNLPPQAGQPGPPS
jgi:hypothetical protein